MINFLHGKLIEALPTQVTVDVHGVGYEVLIPLSSYDKLPAPGGDVKLLTHLAIREDAGIVHFVGGYKPWLSDFARLSRYHVEFDRLRAELESLRRKPGRDGRGKVGAVIASRSRQPADPRQSEQR